jgi:hypothetical protein
MIFLILIEIFNNGKTSYLRFRRHVNQKATLHPLQTKKSFLMFSTPLLGWEEALLKTTEVGLNNDVWWKTIGIL